jgi:hypothetical protein
MFVDCRADHLFLLLGMFHGNRNVLPLNAPCGVAGSNRGPLQVITPAASTSRNCGSSCLYDISGDYGVLYYYIRDGMSRTFEPCPGAFLALATFAMADTGPARSAGG